MLSRSDIQALLAAPPSETIAPETRRELDSSVFLLEQKINALHQNAVGGGDADQSSDLKTWKAVQKSAIELMTRAHDLRVAAILTQALLQTEGFTGFDAGLALILGLLENHWDTLIPEEDKADRDDPFLERINILENLCEWQSTIKPLTASSLCASRATGSFTLRDVRIAAGKKIEMFILTEAEKKAPPQLGAIQAACKEMETGELTAKKTTTTSLKENLIRLEVALKKYVADAKTPDFGPTSEVIAEMDDFYAHQLSLRGVHGAPSVLNQSVGGRQQEAAQPSTKQASNADTMDAPMDTINSRQDVTRLLDQICIYYHHNEPASPVPLLLKRARQLVEKNFYQIMEDLAPKTATELKGLIGEPEDDES